MSVIFACFYFASLVKNKQNARHQVVFDMRNCKINIGKNKTKF